MSFIEYGSTDDARALLKKIRFARNYHLGEAARLIIEFSETYDSSVVQVTIDFFLHNLIT